MNLSARQFDLSIGSANGYTLRMVKNNASVGSDVIEKIANVYPDVNLVWLITGQGDMFVRQDNNEPKISDEQVEALIENKISNKIQSKKQRLLDDIENELGDF